MTKNARWDATIAELQVGFRYNKQHEEYQCLFCEQTFSKGVIYPYHELLLEAQKAIELHIRTQHESPFNQLIQMDKRYTGISEQQRDTLKYFYDGLDDKKIAEIVGGSPSTIRNYRFKLKEKEKQAKVFLVLMALTRDPQKESFIHFHEGARMMDERYAITAEEESQVLETYIIDGKMTVFPRKEKKKLVILRYLMNDFEFDRNYSEKEVNQILQRTYDDFVTLRRYLIEYGFMKRDTEGSQYWKNR
ncbi:DUF2087 domain-containing protein [Alkalihalobacillus sp. LMS6]|uniref:DUF2087 domain-containing protein n=1 Tax=Bacillaceae TaxID=186817 RepID=UPI000C07E5E2|nr:MULTISPECIES: DUF2087 domain-containing protein [Bacillaceae]UTR05865.1 DUF2087 domain-containing protein [Alkalihalobacillus sp. LMS6]